MLLDVLDQLSLDSAHSSLQRTKHRNRRVLPMSTSVDEANSVTLPLQEPAPAFKSRQMRLLPDEPVIKLRPPGVWERIDFAELWAHREVLYFLMWRDLKVRYK